MRKRRVSQVLIAVAVLVGLVVVLTLRSREPEYGGKRLSEWVIPLALSGNREMPPGESQEAILHLGTNALPYLLKWIRYETPPWKDKWYRMVSATLPRLNRSILLTDEKEVCRSVGASFALITLCQQNRVAVQELSKLMNDPAVSPAVAARASNILAFTEQRMWKDSPHLQTK